MRNLIRLSLATAVVILALHAPSRALTGENWREQFAPIDYFGVEFEPRRYSRIVTLAPNLTEIVYFIGAFDRIIGLTNYDDYPPGVEGIERVGGFIDPDIEKIVALQPDLVLAYRGNPLPVIHKLKELGVPVFVLDNPQTLNEVYVQMMQLANLLAMDSENVAGVQRFEADLKQAFERGVRLPRHPRVMMLACSFQPPFYAAGRKTFIHDLIRVAGGENAFRGEGFNIVTPEEFIAADPEFLLLPELPEEGFRAKMLAALRAQPCLAETTALKQHQVIFINQDILSRPGPRIIQALEALQDALMAATSGHEVEEANE